MRSIYRAGARFRGAAATVPSSPAAESPVAAPVREARIVAPPVHADLLGLVDRADEQANLYRQKLDVGEVDLDVSGNDETLVENAIENLDEAGAARWRNEVWPTSSSAKAAQWAQVNLRVFVESPKTRFRSCILSLSRESARPKPLDFRFAQTVPLPFAEPPGAPAPSAAPRSASGRAWRAHSRHRPVRIDTLGQALRHVVERRRLEAASELRCGTRATGAGSLAQVPERAEPRRPVSRRAVLPRADSCPRPRRSRAAAVRG